MRAHEQACGGVVTSSSVGPLTPWHHPSRSTAHGIYFFAKKNRFHDWIPPVVGGWHFTILPVGSRLGMMTGGWAVAPHRCGRQGVCNVRRVVPCGVPLALSKGGCGVREVSTLAVATVGQQGHGTVQE